MRTAPRPRPSKLGELQTGEVGREQPPASAAAPEAESPTAETAGHSPAAKRTVKPKPAAGAAAKKPPAEADKSTFAGDFDKLARGWPKIIEKVGRIAPLIRGALADTRPLRLEKNKVVVGFDPEFKSEMDRMEAPRNRKAVEHAVASLLGRKVAAVFEISTAEPAPAPREEPSDHETSGGQAKKDGTRGKKGAKRNWSEDATVQEALDMFRGSIVDVRE